MKFFRKNKATDTVTATCEINKGTMPTFSSWNEAKKASTGHGTEEIVTKVRDSTLKVKSGNAAYTRDSVAFDRIEYSWPLLAGLMWVASQSNNKLKLVDFGGSLGSTY